MDTVSFPQLAVRTRITQARTRSSVLSGGERAVHVAKESLTARTDNRQKGGKDPVENRKQIVGFVEEAPLWKERRLRHASLWWRAWVEKSLTGKQTKSRNIPFKTESNQLSSLKKRSRRGLVFKAQRLLFHSTLGSRVNKEKIKSTVVERAPPVPCVSRVENAPCEKKYTRRKHLWVCFLNAIGRVAPW